MATNSATRLKCRWQRGEKRRLFEAYRDNGSRMPNDADVQRLADALQRSAAGVASQLSKMIRCGDMDRMTKRRRRGSESAPDDVQLAYMRLRGIGPDEVPPDRKTADELIKTRLKVSPGAAAPLTYKQFRFLRKRDPAAPPPTTFREAHSAMSALPADPSQLQYIARLAGGGDGMWPESVAASMASASAWILHLENPADGAEAAETTTLCALDAGIGRLFEGTTKLLSKRAADKIVAMLRQQRDLVYDA